MRDEKNIKSKNKVFGKNLNLISFSQFSFFFKTVSFPRISQIFAQQFNSLSKHDITNEAFPETFIDYLQFLFFLCSVSLQVLKRSIRIWRISRNQKLPLKQHMERLVGIKGLVLCLFSKPSLFKHLCMLLRTRQQKCSKMILKFDAFEEENTKSFSIPKRREMWWVIFTSRSTYK